LGLGQRVCDSDSDNHYNHDYNNSCSNDHNYDDRPDYNHDDRPDDYNNNSCPDVDYYFFNHFNHFNVDYFVNHHPPWLILSSC
jgi:hypothetical protein